MVNLKALINSLELGNDKVAHFNFGENGVFPFTYLAWEFILFKHDYRMEDLVPLK